jgi:hypothetical protein
MRFGHTLRVSDSLGRFESSAEDSGESIAPDGPNLRTTTRVCGHPAFGCPQGKRQQATHGFGRRAKLIAHVLVSPLSDPSGVRVPLVSVPQPYRGPTRGAAAVQVDAPDVESALRAVDSKFPGFAELIFDTAGGVHRFVKLFVNEEQVERTALDRPLNEDDRLDVMAAIAGG